jgi:Raf kinase inhibitor-like YbhB/YbcL family protein
MGQSLKLLSILTLLFAWPVFAGPLTLTSEDVVQGGYMDKKQEFNGFGCSGEDLSPHLKWSNPPIGTKSFAITAYDPDAPTGSGWWHWQVINLPSNVLELATNAGSVKQNLLPTGGEHIQNDYGTKGFGGACPPKGHGVHHYRFTVHALSIEKIELPENASSALTGYMINANTIESSTIESLYKKS